MRFDLFSKPESVSSNFVDIQFFSPERHSFENELLLQDDLSSCPKQFIVRNLKSALGR